jgi:hypothetical protein
MRARTTSTPPDLNALYQQVLAQMGGPIEVDTPQLGRVAFPRPAELYAALNYLRMAQNAANGIATTGVFVIQHDRGLWPCKECSTNEEFYPAR